METPYSINRKYIDRLVADAEKVKEEISWRMISLTEILSEIKKANNE